MIRYLVHLLFLMLLPQKLYCQKLITQHYSMSNGLPSNEVFTVYKDKIGFIWVATDKGLCKFDGKSFKTYTVDDGLSENSTLEVREDKNGRIWCRSYSGLLTIIDRDSIYGLRINEEIKKLSLGFELYQFEFDDSLNLYLATRNNGLVYKSPFPYNKINLIPLPESNITFYQISPTKHITSYAMVNIEKKQELKTTIALKNKTIVTPLVVNNLDPNFFLRYIRTSKYLVFSTNEIIHTISLPAKSITSKILPFQVSTMALLSDSTFFLGGFNGEVAVFNFNENTYKIIDKFPSSISSIYYENNTCWISTLRNGIYYLPNINYNVIFVSSEPLISMLPISDDSLYLLIANAEIELISKGNIEKLPTVFKQKTLMYWQRFDHSQNDYIPLVGCFDYMIERSTKKKVKFDLENLTPWNQTEFVVPIDSFIYASFYGGLRIFNLHTKKLEQIPINGRATCMFGHKHVLYMGTFNGVYKLENNKSVPLDSHTFFKNRIAAIDKIGHDTLVVATQTNGIGIYNLKTKELSVINKNSGLERRNIQHTCVDEAGKIWIATQQSIHVLKLHPLGTHQILDVVDLNLNDLSIKEVRILNKQVYILRGNQVVKIAEDLMQFNLNSYPVILSELLINGKNRNLKTLASNTLFPSENNLLVKFQLLSYTQNHQIEYRYQLNNTPWSYTSSNELQLVSLPSGTYQLIIQGRLKNGSWSSAMPVNFTISKPFFKTIWFISLLILGALLFFYLLLSFYFKKKYRKRVSEFELKREMESARLMASKSQMNPHFIFNALNSIQNFIIKSEKIQAYQYLTDFSALIRNYLEYSNKDYIKLDKELELINSYIKIEQLRISFQFELSVSENIKSSEEYIFTLLLQPILENAIWHGLNHKTGEKKLMVGIKKVNNVIEIEVIDNGIGREQSAIINANRISKPTSVATLNMHSRINSLKLLYKNDIKLKIVDNFNHNRESSGTTVLISFDTIYEKN